MPQPPKVVVDYLSQSLEVEDENLSRPPLVEDEYLSQPPEVQDDRMRICHSLQK